MLASVLLPQQFSLGESAFVALCVILLVWPGNFLFKFKGSLQCPWLLRVPSLLFCPEYLSQNNCMWRLYSPVIILQHLSLLEPKSAGVKVNRFRVADLHMQIRLQQVFVRLPDCQCMRQKP